MKKDVVDVVFDVITFQKILQELPLQSKLIVKPLSQVFRWLGDVKIFGNLRFGKVLLLGQAHELSK